MEYSKYYEDQTNYQGGGNGSKNILSYVVTALIAFIVGFILAFVFRITSVGNSYIPQSDGDGQDQRPAATQRVKRTPDASAGNDGITPSPKPMVTRRPSAQYDGKLPEISDVSNPIPDIVEQLVPGIVGIKNYAYSSKYKTEIEQGSGTGFVISTEGYILTNAHLVYDADRVTVMFTEDDIIEAEIIGFDKTSDIAVLRIDSKYTTTALALGNSDNVRVGEFAIAIGDPTGRELAGTTTFGIISATSRVVNIDGRTNDYIQTDAAINPGSSGGPLLNMKGEVIGIASAKTVTASYDEYGNAISAEGLGFAIPINDALTIIDQLITGGEIKRPGIGVTVSTINEAQAAYYEMPQGVLVISVIRNGPSDKGGLRASDVIIKCDGKELLTQDDFVDMVKNTSIGDTITLDVWRDGKNIKLEITVGDLNDMGSEEVDEDKPDIEFFG